MFDLSGKIAAVTGANTGLGYAIAAALEEAGAKVVAIGRRKPDRFTFIEADLETAAAASVIDAVGRLDILVNNAGMIRRADALDFSEEDWDSVLDVNLKAPFFLAQAAARKMAAQGGGKIINIASLLSFQGGIRVASYTAAKSGLAGITRLLANEWAAKGINVNAIVPGYFVTNNTEALRNDAQRSEDILKRIPAGRWGKPEDLGGAAIFLASAASAYVHGALIAVDGGWLAR